MTPDKIFEPIGYILSAATAVFSLFLFYSHTQVFFGSLFAALIAAGLVWMTYIILRITWLAIKK